MKRRQHVRFDHDVKMMQSVLNAVRDWGQVEKERLRQKEDAPPHGLVCLYCGAFEVSETPAAVRACLQEHIKTCPDHPLSKALAENEELKARVRELEGLVTP